jgi:hypothetical protein
VTPAGVNAAEARFRRSRRFFRLFHPSSIVKQRTRLRKSSYEKDHAASSSRRARPRLFSEHLPAAGGETERRKAQMCCLASSCEGGSASPCGAPSRRFGARGPCFRDRTGAVASLIRRAFARLRPGLVQPSERQSHVVGPDDDPKPPGRGGCETAARRRRHLIPPRERLRRRPLADEVIGI